jgi:sodium/bile acid cotransporter 7
MLKRYWFFFGIAVVIALAFAFPPAGVFVKQWRILDVGIFLAFLITGLKLATGGLLTELKNIKTPALALLSTFALFPLTAWLAARLCLAGTPDLVVGVCIMAVAPVTVASGLVMTGLAGGNVPLALFICVASNLLCIFTIPPSLGLLLRFDQAICLPVWQMVRSLFFVVIVPIALGQVLRIKLKEVIKPWNSFFSVFSQVIVLLIIFNAVSSSVAKIGQAGWAIAAVLAFMVCLHGLYLMINYGLARGLRLDRPSQAAFVIQTSQKTLTVSYIVWAGWFAAAYPLAMLPAIGYHLTQMVMDTVVAHKLRTANDEARTREKNEDKH